MLVWKAMLSMTWMISPMRCDDSLMRCMVSVTWPTASLLRWATPMVCSASTAACWAESTLSLTVPVICSIDAAVSSRLEACDSVRDDRSWLPAAISAVASRMCSTSVRASRTMDCRFTFN